MTVFLLAAGLLLLLAWALLRPAWTAAPAQGAAATPSAAALAVLRGQLAGLAPGPARDELQRRVLEEGTGVATAVLDPHGGARSLRWIVALGLPLFGTVLYAALGHPAALNPPAPQQMAAAVTAPSAGSVEPAALSAMLANLAKSLETPSADPAADAQGWAMLGRAYGSLQRFADADRALARAVALAPGDAQMLADRADVLTLVHGTPADGEAQHLVTRALQIDPRNLKALALAGTDAYQRQDYATAQRHWQQALALAPAGTFRTGIERSLAEAAERLASSAHQAGAAGIRGRVSLAPALAGRVAPGDTVFVFARAATGPRLPLAVVRATVADLPLNFVLDDSSAMSPDTKLSGSARVVVSARISRTGNATPQSGDLQAIAAPLAQPATGVQLVIDTVLP